MPLVTAVTMSVLSPLGTRIAHEGTSLQYTPLEVPFDIETIRPREPIHEELRAALGAALDEGELSTALAEGAALTDDEALARARMALAG